jgi:hypothetical protein
MIAVASQGCHGRLYWYRNQQGCEPIRVTREPLRESSFKFVALSDCNNAIRDALLGGFAIMAYWAKDIV